MTLNEFIIKYQGKKIDWDKCNGPQCVDLHRQYCNDVLDAPQTPALGMNGGAKDIWEKCGTLKKHSANELHRGDILIYGKSDKNPYGHVCVLVNEFSDGKIIVFEQDGFAQDGAKLVMRTKDNLLGGLYK